MTRATFDPEHENYVVFRDEVKGKTDVTLRASFRSTRGGIGRNSWLLFFTANAFLKAVELLVLWYQTPFPIEMKASARA